MTYEAKLTYDDTVCTASQSYRLGIGGTEDTRRRFRLDVFGMGDNCVIFCFCTSISAFCALISLLSSITRFFNLQLSAANLQYHLDLLIEMVVGASEYTQCHKFTAGGSSLRVSASKTRVNIVDRSSKPFELTATGDRSTFRQLIGGLTKIIGRMRPSRSRSGENAIRYWW